MKLIITLSVVFYFIVSFPNAALLIDQKVGYSLQLPDGWVHEVIDPVHHQFYDTTGTYQSIVAIVRYDFDSAVNYSTAKEWTRANFIAYQITIEADPLSVFAFYDTINARQNDTLWATDAYTYYYDPDPVLGDWAEYLRFTGLGKRGYELYALGPANDLDANFAVYSAIVDAITLLDSPNDISIRHHRRPPRLRPKMADKPVRRVTILGRSMGRGIRDVDASSQLLVIPKKKLLRLH